MQARVLPPCARRPTGQPNTVRVRAAGARVRVGYAYAPTQRLRSAAPSLRQVPSKRRLSEGTVLVGTRSAYRSLSLLAAAERHREDTSSVEARRVTSDGCGSKKWACSCFLWLNLPGNRHITV
jgi:protein tyrosine phosphatase (PTP) superfamily phosphohydrolase (DUF442 family)